MPEVRTDHLYSLLVCSVRYSLGRRSYIVGEVCGMVRQYRKHLREGETSVIARDIQEELERVARQPGATLGMAMDHQEWEKLLEELTHA